jgi:TetR/AcrR family transcriptional regulator, cholesterol catabolism regulator
MTWSSAIAVTNRRVSTRSAWVGVSPPISQLREVARRARTSLATIYKRYGTRDELILAALDCWMEENRYSGLTRPHDTDESIYVGLMRVLRTIFEPWERHPAVLKAYFRARTAPGGQEADPPRLRRRGARGDGSARRR